MALRMRTKGALASPFFVKPLLHFQRRMLSEGVATGEFKPVDTVFFYTHLIGACDHLFHGRHAMSRAAGVGKVTDEVRRRYIEHMTETLLGGLLAPVARPGGAKTG